MGTPPVPRVAVPEGGEEVEASLFRATVEGPNANEDIVRRVLAVLSLDVPVAVLCEDPGVLNLVLGLVDASLSVLLHQLRIRVFGLGGEGHSGQDRRLQLCLLMPPT